MENDFPQIESKELALDDKKASFDPSLKQNKLRESLTPSAPIRRRKTTLKKNSSFKKKKQALKNKVQD